MVFILCLTLSFTKTVLCAFGNADMVRKNGKLSHTCAYRAKMQQISLPDFFSQSMTHWCDSASE